MNRVLKRFISFSLGIMLFSSVSIGAIEENLNHIKSKLQYNTQNVNKQLGNIVYETEYIKTSDIINQDNVFLRTQPEYNLGVQFKLNVIPTENITLKAILMEYDISTIQSSINSELQNKNLEVIKAYRLDLVNEKGESVIDILDIKMDRVDISRLPSDTTSLHSLNMELSSGNNLINIQRFGLALSDNTNIISTLVFNTNAEYFNPVLATKSITHNTLGGTVDDAQETIEFIDKISTGNSSATIKKDTLVNTIPSGTDLTLNIMNPSITSGEQDIINKLLNDINYSEVKKMTFSLRTTPFEYQTLKGSVNISIKVATDQVKLFLFNKDTSTLIPIETSLDAQNLMLTFSIDNFKSILVLADESKELPDNGNGGNDGENNTVLGGLTNRVNLLDVVGDEVELKDNKTGLGAIIPKNSLPSDVTSVQLKATLIEGDVKQQVKDALNLINLLEIESLDFYLIDQNGNNISRLLGDISITTQATANTETVVYYDSAAQNATNIGGTLSNDKKFITFSTDHLSIYSLASSDQQNKPAIPESIPTSPSTSDNTGKSLIFFTCMILLFGSSLVILKKKKRKDIKN